VAVIPLAHVTELAPGRWDWSAFLGWGIFAAWAKVVKRHMLAYPGRSIVFVDEAVIVAEDPAGERAMREELSS
jgi:hypothetical protein